jgi:tRNA pseudouridine55 synthase
LGRIRRRGRDVNGIVLLDKPTGLGSNEVLQIVKRLYGAKKAGHTGSLDRLASGLLPLCFGEATKLSSYLLNANKRYESTFTLGQRTSTGDAEGDVIEERPVPELDAEAIEAVLAKFRGPISQIPPMHSALKVQGQRLYKLAHQGIVIEREPREVTIFELTCLEFDGSNLRVEVSCSKGTYIRTLGEDIGAALGCCAYVSALRRTSAGPYERDEMLTLDHLREQAVLGADVLDSLVIPMESALRNWPSVRLSSDVAYYLKRGQAVLVPHAPTAGWVRITGPEQRFIGVGEVLDDGRIAPRRLVNTAQVSAT